MLNYKLKILFFIVLVTSGSVGAQPGKETRARNSKIDSLKLVLKNLPTGQAGAQHDSTRCRVLIAMIEGQNDDNVWPEYNDELKTISSNNLSKLSPGQPGYNIFKKYEAAAINNIGYLAELHGDINAALEYYHKSLKIHEEINNKEGVANSLNNVAAIYQTRGNIPAALEYNHKSLKLWEEIKHKNGIARSLNNIGAIYHKQGDLAKALEYFLKCLKIREEIQDKVGIARSLNNIGAIYEIQGDPLCRATKEECMRAGQNKALEYFIKGLAIREEIGDKQGVARSLSNIGAVYRGQDNHPKALEYLFRSLKIREEINDKSGIATVLNSIGLIYHLQGNNNKAKEYCLKAFQLSKELGFPEKISEAALGLNRIYKSLGNYQKALENYELFIQMRDSINNETNRKASIKSQLKYEYEKQAAADSVAHAKESEIKNVQLQKQVAEIKVKKNQQYALFGGLGLVIIFSGFMYNRFKITQKQKSIIEDQKKIVEEQKHLVEEKQKEVMDSIHYAKRIQTALLPNEKYIEKSLAKLTNHEGK